MKKKLFTASIIGLMFLSSCSKDDKMNTTLNINYPAAYVVNGEDARVSVSNYLLTKLQKQFL